MTGHLYANYGKPGCDAPDTVDPDTIAACLEQIRTSCTLALLGTHVIPFVQKDHISFYRRAPPAHPTGLKRLDQVEKWFARIQRDVITRGVFTSNKDLDKEFTRYIRQYNKQAAPLKGSTPAPGAASGAVHPV